MIIPDIRACTIKKTLCIAAQDVQDLILGSGRTTSLPPGVLAFMSRLIFLSCFACLSLISACVNTSQPAALAACAKTHSCSGQAGSSGGGSGGTTEATGGQGGDAGSDGGTAATGGAAGSGGGTAGGTGGGGGGTDGGVAGSGGRTDGGVAGNGGGGASGSIDAGSSNDTGTDAPYLNPETESRPDTNPPEPDVQQDVPADAPNPGAETGGLESGPEAGPDASPDIAADLPVDLTPDTSPRPEAGLDAGNCIQRFQADGYSLGTDASTAACGGCKDSGGNSLESTCKAMIACLQPLWPCSSAANCWRDCRNNAHADSVAEACVVSLTSAACGASH
jgi:hypothetical protein